MIHDKRLGGKKYNLTPDSDRNDPIDRRIKSFSFFDFEDDPRYSRGGFSLFFWQNLTFNPFIDTKICLEEEESKRFKDGGV